MNSRLVAAVGAAALAASLAACSTSRPTDPSSTVADSGATATSASPVEPTSVPTNQVAPLVKATYIPEGHSLADNAATDRLAFVSANLEQLDSVDSASGYVIQLKNEPTTVDDVIQSDAATVSLDPTGFTHAGDVTIDGERGQAFQGGGSSPDGSAHLRRRHSQWADLRHHGQGAQQVQSAGPERRRLQRLPRGHRLDRLTSGRAWAGPQSEPGPSPVRYR